MLQASFAFLCHMDIEAHSKLREIAGYIFRLILNQVYIKICQNHLAQRKERHNSEEVAIKAEGRHITSIFYTVKPARLPLSHDSVP